MRTVESLLRDAFQALLRGDYAERDRLCGLAENLINARDRVERSGRPSEITIGEEIRVKPRSY